MADARAKRQCPHAVFIKPRNDYYASVSRQIRDIFEQFTPLVEPLSLDEAFLDATGSESIFGPSPEIGRQIKQRIRSELKLVASVGVAPNKFVASCRAILKISNRYPRSLVSRLRIMWQAMCDSLSLFEG